YRNRTLVQRFSPDFLCYEKIILEIKAVSALIDEHRAQVLNYLAATGCKLGLLVNFGHYPRIEYERLLPRTHEVADLHLYNFRVFPCVSWAKKSLTCFSSANGAVYYFLSHPCGRLDHAWCDRTEDCASRVGLD